ncbi:MAG: multi-sensor signal transduction histidine kinase, partial [uncultured bacterium]
TSIIPPAMTTSLAFLLLGKALVLTSGFCALPSGRNADVTGEGRNIILILVFILVVAGILGAGHLYSRHQEQQFRSRMEAELSTIANLKTSQIEQWRRERLADASMFYENLAFSQLVQRFFEDPNDAEARLHLQMWLEKMKNLPQFFRITLLDPSGTVRLAAPLGFETPVPTASRNIAAGSLPHQIAFSDFHRESPDLPTNLEIAVPILAAVDRQEVLGVLVMEIDPERSLYPLIQSWPTPSPSAEALLVRRDGDDVLFLNDLRFQADAALKLRVPLTKQNLPVVMAVTGAVGIVEGEDYRQHAVVAAIRAVPESPWFMVVKLDRDEINRPLHERLFGLTGLLCAFLLGAGAIFGLVWRNQRAHFYRVRYEAARQLEESAKRLQLIFESVKDGILVAELHTENIINVNEGICRMVGYSRAELLAMRLDDIHAEAVSRDITEKFQMGEASPAIILPMRRRDGSVFHAEINTAPIQFGGQHCMLGTFRDITDRIAAEARIEHLNRVLRAIRSINQLIVRVETVDELIKNACALLVDCRSYTSAIIILTDEIDNPIAHVETGEGMDLRPLIEQIEQGRLPSCCAVAKSKEGVTLIKGKEALCEPCQPASDCLATQRMSIRLEHQQKTYGYLAVSVDLDIIVDIEEERLLIELAEDLAYSLYNMEMKRRMRRTEEEKEKIEAQFIQAQKMEAVGRLAGGLAHDFNNLLTIILGYSTILAEKAASDSFFKEPLAEIHDAAVRATSLTRQLLAFSRKQTLEVYVIDVNQVIEGFAKLLRRSIGEDIQMRLALAAQPALVKA